MTPSEDLRNFLAASRDAGLGFDDAWADGMAHVFRRSSDWRAACEWAKPIFRDAYEGAGKRFKLSEGMLEEVVV